MFCKDNLVYGNEDDSLDDLFRWQLKWNMRATLAWNEEGKKISIVSKGLDDVALKIKSLIQSQDLIRRGKFH